jgi:GTP-binding protein
MLHDRARIEVEAGAGGDGCVSFRREAHVPRGGPDGGDGGHGGTVVFVCDESLRDLRAFRRRRRLGAGRGGHGEGSLRHGAAGEALVLSVPPGTQISGAGGDLEGRSWELLRSGQRATVARGGAGGRGNKRFATATRQAPRFAELGLPGEEGALELKLRLLADVGLVGLPNAGKSSLLARLTRATPKVAGYPFTTLSPVLGVLESDDRQLVIADIPGLIEGASEGAGLGHEFLAHIERTSLLVHVLDIAPEASAGPDARTSYGTIERELAAHDERLARLPRVLALSKCDLVGEERARELAEAWQATLGEDVPVFATSAASGTGLRALAQELIARADVQGAEHVNAAVGEERSSPGEDEPGEALAEHMVFRPGVESGFRVQRAGERSFAVRGAGIERLLARFDIDNEEAMAYFESRLRRIGVLKALRAQGFEAGDEIEIAGVRFELDPGGK